MPDLPFRNLADLGWFGSMFWMFIGIPAAIWCALRLTLPNQRWEFDFDVTHATFFLLLDRYTKIASGIIVAGMAGGFYERWRGDMLGANTCFAAALYALFFVLYVTGRYANYLNTVYQRDGRIGESPYTTSQYALTRTLGYSATIFLLMGLAKVAAQ